MSYRGEKCPSEEQGVSEVVGVILIIGLIVAVFSAYYPIYRQTSIHQLEAEHMEDVKRGFSELRLKVGDLETGDLNSVDIKLGRNTIGFGPDSQQAGVLVVSPANLTTVTVYPSDDTYIVEKLEADAYAYVQSENVFEGGTGGISGAQTDDGNYENIFENTPMGWQYRMKITINENVIDSDLDNFPVTVFLDSSNFNFSHARSDGYDIRFTSSDGTTLLSYERERHDAENGYAEYHVKVPSVSSTENTVIYMYYGKSDATDGADPTAVWGSSFQGVWHYGEAGENVNDSTTSARNLTRNGTTQIDGKVGKGQQFVRTEKDYLYRNNETVLNAAPQATLEAWVKFDTLPNGYASIIAKSSGTSTSSYVFLMQSTTNNKFSIGFPTATSWLEVQSDTTITIGTWYYVVGVYDGSMNRIYINGAQEGTPVSRTGNLNSVTSQLRSGKDYAANGQPNRWMDGVIDEVRISNTGRSAAWVKASYNSGNDSLLSVGAGEVIYYRENVQHNIPGIPTANNYQLQIKHYTAGDDENFSVYLYNFSGDDWENVGNIGSESVTTFTYDLTGTSYISDDNVYVRYVQPDNDSTQTSLMVDYARVACNSSDDNLGGDNSLLIASMSNNNKRAFLKFSLESVPTGAMILKADLWLYCDGYESPTKDVTDVRCYSVDNDDWLENNLTWNDDLIMGSALDSLYVNQVGWISLTVKDFVVQEIDGDNTVSLGLKTRQENYDDRERYISFSSKEVENKKPYLMVTYAVGPSSGTVELTVTNEFYPSQTYVYEGGGVIMVQDGVDIMASEPTIVTASDAEGSFIRVDASFLVVEDRETSIASTGTVAIHASCKSSRYVVTPVDGPNSENVVITISSIYSNAWSKYLQNLRDDLNAKGYNAKLNGLTLTILGKDNEPGVKDIKYYEKLREIEVTVT